MGGCHRDDRVPGVVELAVVVRDIRRFVWLEVSA